MFPAASPDRRDASPTVVGVVGAGAATLGAGPTVVVLVVVADRGDAVDDRIDLAAVQVVGRRRRAAVVSRSCLVRAGARRTEEHDRRDDPDGRDGRSSPHMPCPAL